jgi:hypothetical protein
MKKVLSERFVLFFLCKLLYYCDGVVLHNILQNISSMSNDSGNGSSVLTDSTIGTVKNVSRAIILPNLKVY